MSCFKNILVMMILAVLFTACTPAPVNEANNTLTLHYIHNKIYPLPDCRTKNIDSEYYIFCTEFGNDTGGLYLVKFNDDYTIFSVNGKAIQHSKNFRNIERLNDYRDVSKIIESFG